MERSMIKVIIKEVKSRKKDVLEEFSTMFVKYYNFVNSKIKLKNLVHFIFKI